MSSVNETFAKWLRVERERAGLSQGALAVALTGRGHRVYQQTIAKIEQGERGIELDLAVALAAEFGSTPDVALGLAPEHVGTQAINDARRVAARHASTLNRLRDLINAELGGS